MINLISNTKTKLFGYYEVIVFNPFFILAPNSNKRNKCKVKRRQKGVIPQRKSVDQTENTGTGTAMILASASYENHDKEID